MVDDHPIVIAPAAGRVVVRWRGRLAADSRRALELREADYPPVLYIPREDADMRLFEPSAHETTCPYKGRASYFTLHDGDAVDADAVWSYPAPKPGVAAIKGCLAFYPDRVEIVREPKV
jgi:uncharacterized protein (DUF427 family)